MLLPYTVDVPMRRVPLANWAIMAVTTVISLAILFGVGSNPEGRSGLQRINLRNLPKDVPPEEFDEALAEALREAEGSLPALSLRRTGFSVLQLFSYVLVHGDIIHLAGNMIFLFVFGNAVNAKLGHGLFVAFYFLLGALAGAAWLLLSAGPALVGASGGIMGLVGIFFVLFPKNDVQFYYMFSFAWTGEFRVSSCWVILFYMGCDLYGTLQGGEGGVAYVAHLAGALGGMALALSLVAWGWFPPDYGEENLLQVLGWHEKETRYDDKVRKAKKELTKKRRQEDRRT